MKKHIGRIMISPELFGEIFQFPGAIYAAAQIDPVTLSLEITLEHPAMPEVEIYDGQVIPAVSPVYTMEYYPDGSPKGVKREAS